MWVGDTEKIDDLMNYIGRMGVEMTLIQAPHLDHG